MLKSIISLVLVVQLFSLSQQRLTILEPQELRNQYSNQNSSIKYIPAKFGDKSFNTLMHAEVVLSKPSDDGCGKIDKVYKEEEHIPFVLIKGGGPCSFPEKVAKAQLAGAAMAIIYNQSPQDSDDILINEDNDPGLTIVIPSIQISNEDGIRMLDILRNPQKHIILQMTFDKHSHPNNTLELFVDIQLADMSVTFIKRIFEQSSLFSEQYKFTPYFYLYSEVKRSDLLTVEKSDINKYPKCLGGGRYCLESREMVYNVLFEFCLYKISPTQWWMHNANMVSYIDGGRQNYKELISYKGNYAKYYISYNYTLVEKCMSDSFVTGEKAEFTRNDILEEILDAIEKFKPSAFPTVAINDVVIYKTDKDGIYLNNDIGVDYIFYRLCKETLGSKSIECIHQIQKYEKEINPNPDIKDDHGHKTGEDPDSVLRDFKNLWWVHLLIVLLSILIFVGFALFYRRRLRIFYSDQNDKIGGMVQDYYKLHSARKEERKENDAL